MTKMIDTTINGRWTLKLPEHRAERPEWDIKNGGWEVERLEALHDTIKPGMMVFEVGAEEGDMTALLGQWVGTDGTVFMFEPNEKVWPNVKAIWEANEIPAKFWTFSGFAADTTTPKTPGQLTGNCWPSGAKGELIGDHGFLNLSERPDVPRVTIDYVVTTYLVKPDVINIDCEGSELRVLKGAETYLINSMPIVFVSVHDAFMHTMYDEYAVDLFKYMKDLGYKYELLAYDHELHVKFYS